MVQHKTNVLQLNTALLEIKYKLFRQLVASRSDLKQITLMAVLSKLPTNEAASRAEKVPKSARRESARCREKGALGPHRGTWRVHKEEIKKRAPAAGPAGRKKAPTRVADRPLIRLSVIQ